MKTFAFNPRSLACVLLIVFAVRPAAAQTGGDSKRLDDLAREAARKFAAAGTGVDQTRPTAAAPPPGAKVDLTLDDATARALERNLDIAVERLNPQTFDLNIARIRNAYRPLASSNIGQLSRVQPPTSTLNGGAGGVTNTTTNYNTGLSQLLPGAAATRRSSSTTTSRSPRTTW